MKKEVKDMELIKEVSKPNRAQSGANNCGNAVCCVKPK